MNSKANSQSSTLPLDRVDLPRLIEQRRALHRCPELAFQEIQTARLIMNELDRLGIPHNYGGKGGGVVGRLEYVGEGAPTVALRADMDGLPGNEHTGLPFSSENPGRMHACGHDAHMAMVLGAAASLKQDPPPGNVLFVFQPAEEDGGGARVILDSGELEGIDAIFGAHVTHHRTTGEIEFMEGVMTAQSDIFTIRIRGRGGHGARPHETVDAVVICGLMITALQTLVSRQANPLHPSVVTIGRVEAGSACNVIAEEGILEGTIRTTLPEVREQILTGLERMVSAMAELHDARIELDLQEGYPPLVNTGHETAIARRAAAAVAGQENVFRMDHPTMGAEDFAFYLQQLPGAYVRIGARHPDWEPVALHSPSFTIDEKSLRYGAAFFDTVARESIAESRSKGR
jgi:hippurate hydrolase